MQQLYPVIPPYHNFMLPVSDRHEIYVEETGNPAGIPVCFMHGGPGAGLPKDYSKMFDCSVYRIIAFEQRGCGRSTPFASLQHNTTDHLLADVETLRQHLNINAWVLFGGSWGATLALLTAIAQPDTVLGMILRGVFLARQADIDWYIHPQGGAAQLYPEHYEAFIQDIGYLDSSKAICDAFFALFNQHNKFAKANALRAWYNWEDRISRIQHPYGDPLYNYDLHQVASLAMLECHYIKHSCFIPENYILANLDRIHDIPGMIVHGRYDMICKLESSYSLQQSWPNSQLNIVPNAGHSTSEPGIALALKQATDTMAKIIL
ncbi:MAG: prolyl aminopeptidase [Glaciecola sp.]|jgi:proline iminopeptidase